ncbi:MAG: GH92 family glycosyl hydrolase [Planctomycetota bacterium]
MPSLISYVDPFHAVDKGGNTLCGPYLPFAIARPGPDTWPPFNTQTNGYTSDGQIMRFSQNHVSGTGGASRYGNIAIMPFIGGLKTVAEPSDKADETASSGYYSVRLVPDNIRVAITSTARCARYRINYPSGKGANLLIDAGSAVRNYVSSKRVNLPHSVGGFIEKTSDTEIVGRADIQGGWGHDFPYSIFFCAQTDKPIASHLVMDVQGPTDSPFVSGPNCKIALNFETTEELNLTIGISYVSVAKARESITRESANAEFDTVRKNAETIWEKALSQITVSGGADNDRSLFYTMFSRLLCMPGDLGIDDENPWWVSGVRNFTDFYCLWDSVRNANSLIALFNPDLHVDFMNCLLDVADHIGWLPDAWIAGHSAHVQGGSSADILFCESALKGIKGIDYAKALKQMRKNNEVVSPTPYLFGRYLEDYRDLGFVSTTVLNCASRHIEYSYQDWCIGRLAEQLGEPATAKTYYDSSRKLYNLWNDELKCFAPKDPKGNWAQPFDPYKPQRWDYWNDPHFYEGIAYEWSLTAIHDIAGIIERHGGRAAFIKHLDTFFDSILYHWKEMILHTPLLYHYAGRPDKSSAQVRRMLRKKYGLGREGMKENEDMGANSTYVMCAMMGLYPIMGQDVWLLTAPMFEKSEIKLGATGKTFVISAPGGSETNAYITGAKLNGKDLNRAFLRHSEISGGGILELTVSDTATNWGQGDVPPSPLQTAGK